MLAKWDGRSWSIIRRTRTGSGSSLKHVKALAVFDDGSGRALYVGGDFYEISDVADTHGMARWNGQSWSSVGGESGPREGSNVIALQIYDDGSGTALHASGSVILSGQPGGRLVKWDGSTWSAWGQGIGSAFAIAVLNTGSGPAFYAGGGTNRTLSSPFNVAKWNGTSWSPFGLAGDGDPTDDRTQFSSRCRPGSSWRAIGDG